MLAVGIYSAEWDCRNPLIPNIKIYEHFDYNYGFVFAILGTISSILVLMTTLFATSAKDGTGEALAAEPITKTLVKIVGGTSAGLVTLAALMLIVMGANDFHKSEPVDPNFNYCEGQKPDDSGIGDSYFTNTACEINSVVQTLEQAGANVTRGYRGGLDAGDRVPITQPYDQTDLCPVNVHWHLGAEHYSAGQFDSTGTGPAVDGGSGSGSQGGSSRRQLAGSNERLGFRCHHYDASDTKFTTPYNWQYCTNMLIGETYEIHWPHSAAGACGTDWQYQSPFYDGVFCRDGIITIAPLNTYQTIGVQSQTFVVVNDESPQYQYDNLIDDMIVEASTNKGQDMAIYTGSTTGTSRDNLLCSRYTPITWQVDRQCHMVSASSWDKMCQDMLAKRDDMSSDLYPHGARTLVADHLTADNQQSRRELGEELARRADQASR